jgi:hypothetical protein
MGRNRTRDGRMARSGLREGMTRVRLVFRERSAAVERQRPITSSHQPPLTTSSICQQGIVGKTNRR